MDPASRHVGGAGKFPHGPAGGRHGVGNPHDAMNSKHGVVDRVDVLLSEMRKERGLPEDDSSGGLQVALDEEVGKRIMQDLKRHPPSQAAAHRPLVSPRDKTAAQRVPHGPSWQFSEPPFIPSLEGRGDFDGGGKGRQSPLRSRDRTPPQARMRTPPPLGKPARTPPLSDGGVWTPPPGPASEEGSLLASMARRLAQAEKDLREAQAAVRTRDRTNERLRRETADLNARLHAARTETARLKEEASARLPPSHGDAVKHLQSENARLRRQSKQAWGQVAELKKFLNDYGMVWVGTAEEGGVQVRGAGASPDYPEGGGGAASAGTVADKSENADLDLEEITTEEAAGGDPEVGGREEEERGAGARTPGREAAPPAAALGRREVEVDPRSVMDVDAAQLAARIKELNLVAGDGRAEVVTGPGGERRLRMPEPYTITLWRDGIQTQPAGSLQGPFRSFIEPAARAVITDILDGYFPYELKDRYPEGVPFRLVDRASMLYSAPTFQPFQGAGMRLSRDGDAAVGHNPGRAGGFTNEPRDLRSIEEGAQGPVSSGEYLSRLPAAVIRNGRVIEVRAEVEAMIRGGGGGKGDGKGSQGPDVVDTRPISAAAAASRSTQGEEGGSRRQQGQQAAGGFTGDADANSAAGPGAGGGPSAAGQEQEQGGEPGGRGQDTTLQVKSEDGQQTFVLKMASGDTLGDLRRYLDRHRGSAGAPYEIRSGFPPQAYTDPGQTLLDAGLVPRSALFLRRIS